MRLLTSMLLLLPLLLQAGDLTREQQVTEALEKGLRQGSAIKLKAQGESFLAIHEEADSKTIQGGVILLHDAGGHADFLDVIQPLRVGLPSHDWETLSLQLPLATPGASATEYESLLPEAFPRIKAAIDFIIKRKINQIVLIGHGLGGRMALRYLSKNQKNPRLKLKGLIAIGMALDKNDKETQEALKKLELPVLDIMADGDLPEVLASKQLRRKMARYGGNDAYQQGSIIGADHLFQGRDEILLLRLSGWLRRYMANANPINYKAIK